MRAQIVQSFRRELARLSWRAYKRSEAAFGVACPHSEDGPHLAALTIGCHSVGQLADLPLARMGDWHVLVPTKKFGTATGFVELTT